MKTVDMQRIEMSVEEFKDRMGIRGRLEYISKGSNKVVIEVVLEEMKYERDV